SVAATSDPIVTGTWKKIVDNWTAGAKDSKAKVLVSFEHSDANNKYLVFGWPAFEGESPTAASALADDPGTTRRGFVVLGYDLAPLEVEKAKAAKQKTEALNGTAIWSGAVGAMFVLIGTLLAIFQGLSISKPIKMLAWKADQIARGDLEARVEVKSTD